MKFERVTYQELLPTGSFLNVRLGVDILLEKGDDPKVAFATARELVKEYHKEGFEQVYVDEASERPLSWINQGEKENTEVEQTLLSILSSQDISTLETFKFLTLSNPQVKEAYQKKYSELAFK